MYIQTFVHKCVGEKSIIWKIHAQMHDKPDEQKNYVQTLGCTQNCCMSLAKNYVQTLGCTQNCCMSLAHRHSFNHRHSFTTDIHATSKAAKKKKFVHQIHTLFGETGTEMFFRPML